MDYSLQTPESPIIKIPSKETLINFTCGLLFFLILWVFFQRCKKKIEKDKEKKDLVRIQISYIFCYMILIVGVILTLVIFGISKITIISLFSFIGITLGLAVQNSISKVISSFEMVFLNNYKIGDKIVHLNPSTMSPIEGIITDFNLWNTTITNENKHYIIPNNMINNNIIIK